MQLGPDPSSIAHVQEEYRNSPEFLARQVSHPKPHLARIHVLRLGEGTVLQGSLTLTLPATRTFTPLTKTREDKRAAKVLDSEPPPLVR